MTAAINSRSPVSSSHADDVEAPPARPAAAPPPPPPARANRVEAWSGQATVPRSSKEVLAEVDKRMMKNSLAPVRDFFVTERDARESVAMLAALPSPEFKKALEEMSMTTRSQLFSEMDSDTRKTFFDAARNKGALTEEPGVKMPPCAGSPPDKPALLRNDRSLPSELRTAIHEENKTRTAQYMRDFDGYVSRYSQAALRTSSPLELRKLGPPRGEFVLTEPGVAGNDKLVPTSLEQGKSQLARAAKAANDRLSDFAGRARAGSYGLTLEGKAGMDIKGHGGEIGFSAKLTDCGRVSGKLKGEAEVAVIPGLAVGITSEGKTYQELKVKDFRVRTEGGKISQLEGKVAGVGVSRSEGKTTLSLGAQGEVPIGTFATIDDKHGSFGGGVKVEGKQQLGGMVSVEASLKLGVIAQGVAPERVADIASMRDDGIWGPMPELEQGVKWSSLPNARRDRLARDGWSAGNWPNR